MAEITHFERRKMVLVKIPVIVLYMEQTKVSGADAVKPSELRKRKVLRESSRFLLNTCLNLQQVILLAFLY